MAVVSADEARRRLEALPGWTLAGNEIRKIYRFTDFRSALAFVNRVAGVAEAMNHHPDVLLQFSRVTLTLTSHDAGTLTERDFRLAGQIDS